MKNRDRLNSAPELDRIKNRVRDRLYSVSLESELNTASRGKFINLKKDLSGVISLLKNFGVEMENIKTLDQITKVIKDWAKELSENLHLVISRKKDICIEIKDDNNKKLIEAQNRLVRQFNNIKESVKESHDGLKQTLSEFSELRSVPENYDIKATHEIVEEIGKEVVSFLEESEKFTAEVEKANDNYIEDLVLSDDDDIVLPERRRKSKKFDRNRKDRENHESDKENDASGSEESDEGEDNEGRRTLITKTTRIALREIPDFIPGKISARLFQKKVDYARDLLTRQEQKGLLKGIVANKLLEEAEIDSLRNFKDLMRHVQSFESVESRELLEEELAGIRQAKDESVEKFAIRCQNLITKLRGVMTRGKNSRVSEDIKSNLEERLNARFQRGLDKKIKQYMRKYPNSFRESVKEAKEVEKEAREEEEKRESRIPRCDHCRRLGHLKKDCRILRNNTGNSGNYQNTPVQNSTPAPNNIANTSNLSCTFCNKPGHTETTCYAKLNKCYRCGESGHRIPQCPKLPKNGAPSSQS